LLRHFVFGVGPEG